MLNSPTYSFFFDTHPFFVYSFPNRLQMKKILLLLLALPLFTIAQEQDPCYSINDYNETTSSSNPPITLDLLSGWNMMGFSCVNEGDANAILSPISDKISLAKNNAGSVYMPEFGFNGIGNLIPNQGYQIKMSEAVIGFELCSYHINYHQVGGCTDCEAINFNRWATSDDGSCEYNNCTDSSADNYGETLPCLFYGCNDPLAANFDPYANSDDGSCVVAEACPYENYLEYSSDAISYNANLCVNIIVEGCTDNTALNYNPQANLDDESCEFIYGCIDQDANNYNLESTTDDGSCIYYGCMDPTAGNYDELANTDDGDCLSGGCMNTTAENYNSDAGVDDGSCVIYGCLLSDFPNYNSVASTDDGSCNMNSADVFGCTDESTWNYQVSATVDNGSCRFDSPLLGEYVGGGIVFYINELNGTGYIVALEDVTSIHPDGFIWGCEVVNDVSGMWWGYSNTINLVNQECNWNDEPIAAQAALDFESGGYNDWFLPAYFQLMMAIGSLPDAIGNEHYWSSTSYYDWSASTNIYQQESIQSHHKVRAIRAIGFTSGCIDSIACNFNPEANQPDGSCEYAEQGYDCDGYVVAEIGDEFQGGLLFYIDETGEHGLVAALQDLPSTYQWGCYGLSISGADGTALGTGYQNTLDIVAGCSENPMAASESLAYESLGYTDWYLPSKDELKEMYNTIGNGGAEDDIGGFVTDGYYYLSSSEGNYSGSAWYVNFSDGETSTNDKYNGYRVRVIRAFGSIIGCIDSLACNYSPEANTDNGTCEYPETDYNCDGILLEACPYDIYVEFSADAQSYNANLCQTLIVLGCTDYIAENYNNQANTDDNSCTYIWACTDSNADNYNLDATQDDSSCIYLGCMDEMADNFNPLANQEDSSCIYYGCMNSTANNYNSQANENDASCIIYGCTLEPYSNYNDQATFDDGSCDMNSFDFFGCGDSIACNYNDLVVIENGTCVYIEEGYDCHGNEFPYYVGQIAYGGIIFYVDETGKHGLVANIEDLETTHHWASANSAALNYESEDYLDWYLPSKDELSLLWSSIGSNAQNIGGFVSYHYWSSTETGYTTANFIVSNSGIVFSGAKDNHKSVRPIRSF